MDFLDTILLFLPICGLTLLVLFIGIVISYFVLTRQYKKLWVCPECGGKETIDLIDSDESVLLNKVDYTRRVPVRMKEIEVTDQYQCNTCRHKWTRTFIKKEHIRLDRKNLNKISS